MKKEKLLHLLSDSILSKDVSTAAAYEKYFTRIEDLLFCIQGDTQINGLSSVDTLAEYISQRSFADIEIKFKVLIEQLKAWLSQYRLDQQASSASINSAQKTMFELDGETFLSLASILTAVVLLIFSIISTVKSCKNIEKYLSFKEGEFWSTSQNGDTITMIVTGIIMLIGGIFFLVSLFGSKRKMYQNAQKTLVDAGMEHKSLNVLLRGKKNIMTGNLKADNNSTIQINTGKIKK